MGTGEPDGGSDTLLAGLRDLLADDPDVVALGVFGSGITAQRDAWSDLDAVVVVKDRARDRFFPGLAWLRPLGEVFAFDQSSGPWSSTTRICFADFSRLDLVLATESAVAAAEAWPRVPFWGGCRVVFTRSWTVAAALRRGYAPPGPGALDAGAFAAMANDFWFKATQAVVKVVRGDRLIALHLALDLLRDCCVLAMLLRDRETGTSQHRDGGSGNAFVDGLPGSPPGYGAAAILDLVEESANRFDRLGAAWTPAYVPRAGSLTAWIARARGSGTEGALRRRLGETEG